MLYQVETNPSHEHDKRIAFLEQIRAWDHTGITMIVGRNDLIDRDGPIALSNLAVDGYQLKLVDVVKTTDGEQLYPVVNKD